MILVIQLDRSHDPCKNKELISSLSYQKEEVKDILVQTDSLFDQLKPLPAPRYRAPLSISTLLQGIPRMILSHSSQKDKQPLAGIHIKDEEEVYPDWKDLLDQEYIYLQNELGKEVNVMDFGAAGDGVTDDTEAFKKAIGTGRVRVYVPEGIYVTRGVRLPSFTSLVGAGKKVTTIKLHDRAPRSRQLVTNDNHWRGNSHISVEGLTLDWNVERLNPAKRTASGNNRSSCLTFAHVSFGWVKEVEGVNPGLHCFDISSAVYTYFGDGTRARRGSRYIWLDQLTGYGFGDDGITTHHSDYVFISNCHMSDPSGRAHQEGFSNSNGIEVDDGSRNVILLNNSTARCFGGVEIKAHHNSAAASSTQVIGHLSLHDNRAYNFRHIGHHIASDPESCTAYNIKASQLIAIAPIRTDLYKDSTPRAMVISAYKNVAINHFTVIGDPNYDYKGEPVIAVQYRARNVLLNEIHFKDFVSAGPKIKVFGGNHGAEDVTIRNVTIQNSSSETLEVGKSVKRVNTENVHVIGVNGSIHPVFLTNKG